MPRNKAKLVLSTANIWHAVLSLLFYHQIHIARTHTKYNSFSILSISSDYRVCVYYDNEWNTAFSCVWPFARHLFNWTVVGPRTKWTYHFNQIQQGITPSIFNEYRHKRSAPHINVYLLSQLFAITINTATYLITSNILVQWYLQWPTIRNRTGVCDYDHDVCGL